MMADTTRRIKIGTRASKLALVQSDLIKTALNTAWPAHQVEVIHITTSGDIKQGTKQAGFGDKKDWILELERAILAGTIDCAVHSGKDVPADIEAGTALIPVLERETPYDVFVGRRITRSDGSLSRYSFLDVPKGGLIGTASKRRSAQLLRLRPDLRVQEHRGNVPTRIDKLDNDAELSGIVLAQAGLTRLGLDSAISYQFSIDEMMPAVNQGILVIQFRNDDGATAQILSALNKSQNQVVWNAERACVERLGADCNSSVCVYAETKGESVELCCRILSADGSCCVEERGRAPWSEARLLGDKIGDKVLAAGGRDLI